MNGCSLTCQWFNEKRKPQEILNGSHRIHGTGIFTYIYHTNQANIWVNIPFVPMDPSLGCSENPSEIEHQESPTIIFKHHIHHGRLTWNLQITHFERKMIFQTSMIMFHVNLQGCRCYLCERKNNSTLGRDIQVLIIMFLETHIMKPCFTRVFRVPSRELTYPTWGKGNSSSKVPFYGIC